MRRKPHHGVRFKFLPQALTPLQTFSIHNLFHESGSILARFRILRSVPDRDLVVTGYDRRFRLPRLCLGEFHVTALLAYFFESRSFQAPLDLAEAGWLKQPQPLPRCDVRPGLRGSRRFEKEFQRFSQVIESFFCSALARNINVKALRNEPFSFAPNSRRKRILHESILARSRATARIEFSRRTILRNSGV